MKQPKIPTPRMELFVTLLFLPLLPLELCQLKSRLCNCHVTSQSIYKTDYTAKQVGGLWHSLLEIDGDLQKFIHIHMHVYNEKQLEENKTCMRMRTKCYGLRLTERSFSAPRVKSINEALTTASCKMGVLHLNFRL